MTCSRQRSGHANLNPAHSCFLDVMGGVPDGSNNSGALTYNRASCYETILQEIPLLRPRWGLTAVVN